MALVSVVMPTCNRPHFIGTALDSALAQTMKDFVVLIGDDSQSDVTERLIADSGDPRIRYHRNQPGLGATGNWLDLIRRVETPFLATLHDDDKWHPQFLEEMVEPLKGDPDIAMSYCDFWLIDENDQTRFSLTEQESARTGRDSTPTGPVEYDRAEGLRLVAVDNAPQPAYAAVLRTDAVRDLRVPSDIEPLYDIWCSYQLVKHNCGLHYVNKRLTSYRVHDESATGQGFGDAEDAVFQRILDENPDAGAVLEEIRGYWGGLQWARGTRLMDSLASLRPSQEQLAKAIPNLGGVRSVLASAATRFAAIWHVTRLMRLTKQVLASRH